MLYYDYYYCNATVSSCSNIGIALYHAVVTGGRVNLSGIGGTTEGTPRTLGLNL